MHKYCEGYDPVVEKILKTLEMLQLKQEELEKRQGKLEKEVGEINMKMQRDATQFEKKIDRIHRDWMS